MLRVTALILLLILGNNSFAADPLFAIASTNTPVLNTPDFRNVFGGKNGNSLQKDNCGQLRALEFVALPGTVFRIEAELNRGGQKIFRVTTADYSYPSKSGYFIDARFVKMQSSPPPERTATLPVKEEIIAALKKRAGSRYVWGGNRVEGVAELLSWYPPAEKSMLTDADKSLWNLSGVDCSGLLYDATNGFTPRNTSALASFGKGVKIAGKGLQEISEELKPLDLLVWPGHVLIVIDAGNIIESRLVCQEPDKGVRIRPISEALSAVMKERKASDVIKSSGKEFVVRRWY